MHSSLDQKHISGAERLLGFSQLEEAASAMLQRALSHPRGAADHISLTVQSLKQKQVRKHSLLKFASFEVDNYIQGRDRAQKLLEMLDIDPLIVRNAISLLATGPSASGGVMRGAALINVDSGDRLELDQSRGVRVSRMDLDPAARSAIELFLKAQTLTNPRIIEAWVLASKVALYPQVVAELCWSDDPDYLTGYVASAQNGYQRITHLKESGCEMGGRVFFVRPVVDLNALIDLLQNEPVLFGSPLMESHCICGT